MEHLARGIICGVTLSVAVVAAAWAREPIMGSMSKHAGTPCVAGQEPQEDRKGLERRQKAPSGPHMAFDRTSHDFGDVARHGGDLIKEFRFVNDGDEPLVIKKITKACSCLTVSYSRKPVLPRRGIGHKDQIRAPQDRGGYIPPCHTDLFEFARGGASAHHTGQFDRGQHVAQTALTVDRRSQVVL